MARSKSQNLKAKQSKGVSASKRSKASGKSQSQSLTLNSTALDCLPTTAHPILSNYFGYCLSKSLLRLKTDLMAEFAPLGVHPPQAGILDILSTSGPINQLGIGEAMGIDKATMVKLIDSIEALGLVERKTDPQDRRAKTIEITSTGKKLLPKIKAARARAEDRFLAGLSKQEAETYRALTKKLFLSRYV